MIKKGCMDILQSKCESCNDCIIGNSRQNVVFGEGNPEIAKIMFIGEVPNETEDETGVPFVGRSGQLFNEFLASAGISRENDVYLVNTMKCRPPENRIPTEVEKSLCERYLIAQIDIMQPKIIVLCGAAAYRVFYKDNKKIQMTKLRGSWFDMDVNGKTYKTMAIFSPAYLLRNRSMEEGSPRRLMQEDLALIKSEMDKISSNPFKKDMATV